MISILNDVEDDVVVKEYNPSISFKVPDGKFKYERLKLKYFTLFEDGIHTQPLII